MSDLGPVTKVKMIGTLAVYASSYCCCYYYYYYYYIIVTVAIIAMSSSYSLLTIMVWTKFLTCGLGPSGLMPARAMVNTLDKGD